MNFYSLQVPEMFAAEGARFSGPLPLSVLLDESRPFYGNSPILGPLMQTNIFDTVGVVAVPSNTPIWHIDRNKTNLILPRLGWQPQLM